MGAVSARRILGPSETGIKPASITFLDSSGDKSPSGPVRIETERFSLSSFISRTS